MELDAFLQALAVSPPIQQPTVHACAWFGRCKGQVEVQFP